MVSSWLAEQEVRGSIPGLASTISEIGHLLLPSHDMAERSLKRRKSSKQPTNGRSINQDYPLFVTFQSLHGTVPGVIKEIRAAVLNAAL